MAETEFTPELKRRLLALCNNLAAYVEHSLLSEPSAETIRQGLPVLFAELDRREAETKRYKTYLGQYSDCLQKLSMDVLYDHCKPISHGWPGKPHTETIVEGVNHLLARITGLERELAEARNREGLGPTINITRT